MENKLSVARPGSVVTGMLIVVVLLAGCAGASSRAAGRDPVTTTAATYRPVARTVTCDARVPARLGATCGVLTVPEDRSQPRGPDVELPYVVVPSTSAHPAVDPVVYLSGGPGDSGIAQVKALAAAHAQGDHPLIVFDQRGTGTARPSLACPEVAAVAWEPYSPDPEARRQQVMLDAYATCRRRLVAAGVDLDAFNTTESADDVADLRAALHIRQWDLWGVSYGTTLALEVLRAHPTGLRAVVLDSPVPADVVPNGAHEAADAANAFSTLFAGCASSPTCARTYPNLEATFSSVIGRLDTHPYVTSITDATGAHAIRYTGDDLEDGIFEALYRQSFIPDLPSAINTYASGDYSSIRATLPLAVDTDDRAFAAGMFASTICGDQGALDQDDTTTVLRAHPTYGPLLGTPPLAELCRLWLVRPAQDAFHHLYRTAVPTLVIAGRFDPDVPATQSQQVASQLGARFVEFADEGHVPTVNGQSCPQAVLHSFLDDPSSPPDSCAATTGPPHWLVDP
jgi:pimeloyl-ACP methyl ester carboxylesterase